MNIDEAITHARQVAEGCPVKDRQCAYQHDELADWLEELKAYRATGLKPEEIEGILERGTPLEGGTAELMKAYLSLGSLDHLQELVQAEAVQAEQERGAHEADSV